MRTDRPRKMAEVSIHAPARGATSTTSEVTIVSVVSIHAPARGATPKRERSLAFHWFQFTRPQEARPSSAARTGRAQRFQFTRPQEARQGRAVGGVGTSDVSIHAPARGATGATRWIVYATTGFNSRARKRRDRAPSLLVVRGAAVSIHAPARGATFLPQGRRILSSFQFTRPQEARRAHAVLSRF